jgi:hypothetical protein
MAELETQRLFDLSWAWDSGQSCDQLLRKLVLRAKEYGLRFVAFHNHAIVNQRNTVA